MKTINTLFVAAVTFAWASVYWLGNGYNIALSQSMTSLQLAKPFVYRQLVPLLARTLSITGIRIDLALVLVVTFCGIGFYLALRELVFLFQQQSKQLEVLIILSVFAGLLLFNYPRLPYDLMTAFFFTLAVLYIIKGETKNYLLLFPFICLNRETAILLTGFFVAHALYVSPKTIKPLWREIGYQVIIYVIIMLGLRMAFVGNTGAAAWIEPLQNLRQFIAHPLLSALHFLTFSVVLFMVTRDWNNKPLSLRLAFLVIFIPLLPLYFIFGQAFEVRVFWEVYPFVSVLSLPTVVKWTEWIKHFTFTEATDKARQAY